MAGSDNQYPEPAADGETRTRLIIWPRWDRLPRWRLWLAGICLGVVGIAPGWLLLGALGTVPSIVAVFGWSGIRLPAAVVVGCLLLASLALGQA